MKSRTTISFWKRYWTLPPEIRQGARRTYVIWRDNPKHPSLFFRRVKESQPLYSIRIGLAYRAIGWLEKDTITWYWIGNHDEYNDLIN